MDRGIEAPESMRVRQPRGGRGRGRGRGRTAASTSGTTPGSSRGASKRGRGRGRGGKQTGKKGKAVPDAPPESDLDDDDGDEICNQAWRDFELHHNEIALGFSALNKETTLPGFDPAAGDIWIYPTNKPVRDYQFNIVQTALFNNTLVSLPTGLGKTFIAAVVMFNFNRWYPDGIIVFMAPTKPLVAQQLDACHNIMGISPTRMAELTGQLHHKKREEVWKEKNVLFLTPQVMMGDLERGYCPADKVRLVVVDEAHRSQGNYSYVQVIAKLIQTNKCFRIVALSATPGNNAAAVQKIFKNLLISKVELRSDKSPDILPYARKKEIDTVVVKLDDNCRKFHDKILELFQHYIGKLMQQNAIPNRSGTNMTQYQLVNARLAYRAQAKELKEPPSRKGLVELNFATAISLVHSLELITIHGLRSFYSFLNGVITKEKGHGQVTTELKRNTNVEEILEELRTLLKISSNDSSIKLNASGFLTMDENDDRTNVTMGEDVDYFIGHPKFKALSNIVQKHFENYTTANQSTRVMIFSQYRDSVQEIGSMLNTLRPLVKPMVFVGQSSNAAVGKGLTQKEQVQVVQKFRDGGYNVLVSTSVGEEGLDIGEVDLIVCFDCLKSPTRLIQRMGRTGRQRMGRTVFLLTHGREESSYRASIFQTSNINKSILDTSKFDSCLLKETPRMIPFGVEPQCYKMDIILSSEQGKISNRGQAKASVGHVKSKDDSPGKNLMNTSGKELTLTQCFRRGGEIMKKSSKQVAVSPAKPVVVVIEEEKERDNEDEGHIVVNEFYQNENNVGDTEENEAYYNSFCKIFNIQNISNEVVADCVRIPNPAPPFEWRKGYGSFPVDKLVLRGKELDSVLEEADVEMFMGDNSTHCGCGLAYMEDHHLCAFDDNDFELESTTVGDPVNPHPNSIDTGEDLFPSPDDNKKMELLVVENDENPRQGSLVPHHETRTEADPDAFDAMDLPDFDIGFLLEDDEDLDHDSPSMINSDTKLILEAELSPIIPTRPSTSPNHCDVRVLPTTPPSAAAVQHDSPNRLLSPIITSQSFARKTSHTPDNHVKDIRRVSTPRAVDFSNHCTTLDRTLSPIITKTMKTPEKNTFTNAVGPGGEDLASSPVFIHNSTSKRESFCASTPVKSADDREIRQTSHNEEFSLIEEDLSDSEEILPASPERKSVPVIKSTDVQPVQHEQSSDPHVFKIPTPVRNVVKRFSPLNQNSFAPGINTKPVVISPNLASVSVNTSNDAPKRRFVFKERVPSRIVPESKKNELPSVSLAAALRAGPAPPVSSIEADAGNKNVDNDATELDDLIISQRLCSNPFTADNHLRLLSRHRVRDGDTNVASTSKGGWRSVDRPKASPNFGSHQSTTARTHAAIKHTRPPTQTNEDFYQVQKQQIRPKRKKKRRVGNVNPFVEDEASVSGDDDSSDTAETSNSDADDLESFVEEDNDMSVTESQQVRYLKSTRDMPANFGRVERPLEPQNHMTLMNMTEADYENDSFCVGDEVEYVEVGNFTQAMIHAQVQIEKEIQGGNQKKRKARLDSSSSESPGSESRKPPAATRMNLRSRKRLFSPEPEPTTKPRRKRIIEYDDTSD